MALPYIPVGEVRMQHKKRRKLIEHLSRYEVQKLCGVKVEYADLLFDLLEPLAENITRRNRAVPVETQVLLCLGFFRSGTFQYIQGTTFGVSQSTASRILSKMCNSIVTELMPRYIEFSNNIEQLNFCSSKFNDLAHFPNVVGLVDGTHINSKAPLINEIAYVNRKIKHSINCQIVCDWDNSFMDVVTMWPGSSHDSFIWGQSYLRDRFADGQFGTSWLLGDSGYGCEPCLLTPFLETDTDAQNRYNRSHMATRSLIERSIGIWKSKWRSMDCSGGTLCYNPGKVCQMVISTAVLHNFCVQQRILLIEDDEARLRRMLHNENNDMLINNNPNPGGVQIRENVVQTYFNGNKTL